MAKCPNPLREYLLRKSAAKNHSYQPRTYYKGIDITEYNYRPPTNEELDTFLRQIGFYPEHLSRIIDERF